MRDVESLTAVQEIKQVKATLLPVHGHKGLDQKPLIYIPRGDDLHSNSRPRNHDQEPES
jgi:hypothetical protein